MISVAIMAHPARAQWIPSLVDAIDGDPQVVWDEGWNDRHRTGLNALRAYDPAATHHLIVQDDAIVCRDLVASVSRAAAVSGDHPICLYTGRVQPSQGFVRRNVEAAKAAGACWFAMQGPWWGVGIVVPTAHIDELSRWFERSSVANYDRRIARWYGQQGIDCWYTVPSLVEHRVEGNPSLTKRTGTRRKAHTFIGHDRSALTIQWVGPAFDPSDIEKGPTMARFRNVRTGRTVEVTNPNLLGSYQNSRRWEATAIEDVAGAMPQPAEDEAAAASTEPPASALDQNPWPYIEPRHAGGGWFEITHSDGRILDRVRGKAAAEQRAVELASTG